MSFYAKNGKILSPFKPTPSGDLVYYGGKTIPNLNFFNFYLGGSQSWDLTDMATLTYSGNSQIGQNTLWLMNGTNITTSATPPELPIEWVGHTS